MIRPSLLFAGRWGCALVMACLPACAQVQAGRSQVDLQAPIEVAGQRPGPAIPTTLEERYPYIRFLRSGDVVTAMLTVPTGFGKTILAQLQKSVPSLSATPPSATLEVMGGAGVSFSGDPNQKPWTGVGTMKPVEDILLVRGQESGIEDVLDFIDLFYNGSPQIEIQAEIFEVTDTDAFERGIQAAAANLVQQTGGVSSQDTGPFFRGLGGGFPSASNPSFTGAGPGGVFSLAFVDDKIRVDAFLQILRSMEGVDIVSRPRVVVRNGVTAQLISTEEIPYLKPSAISAQGTTAFAVDTKKAGVELYVQPFLLGADSVHLVISAKASRIGRFFFIGTDTQGNPITVPSVNSREATTSITVHSGQRVVIGGLRLREERTVEDKIPLLGDIPLLGWLFSSKVTSTAETEVMFVITPNVKTRAPSISAFSEDIFDPFADTSGTP